ncbi:MAG: quinone oxidoreductase, partial [Myxococcota bacterium]|nr:quinone oxidoreductase [Myxococcota bacterium]
MPTNAIYVREIGGPQCLSWEPQELRQPGDGQVRIAVTAAGVNFIDVYFRSGQYPRPVPFTLGLEGAGVIEAVGPNAGDFAAGDGVAWSGVPGSYAQDVNAPVGSLVKIPDGVDLEVAAACMLQGMTAHYLCRSTYEVQAGDTALVHAAAGGVGLLLIQMLRSIGADVIGTCSTAEKEVLAKGAGAGHVIRYDECDFAERVNQITNGQKCDVVFDSVGQSTFEGSLASLRPRGTLALFGQSSGAVEPFDLQRLNQHGSLYVTRPSLAHYMATREEFEMRAGAVLGSVAGGELDVRIGDRFAMADAAEA